MDRLGVFLIGVGSVMALATIVLTVVGVAALRDFRRTLHEAHTVFSHARRLLARADDATVSVARVLRRTCALTTEALDSMAAWKARAEHWLGPVIGHGNGHRPRH
ncbi:MAG: hypothetical protein HY600_00395 [Candidatus Omnitrophica bacterium]|nr:hypothetical protein [Candidatus Omnitrophota bacterium]